MLMNIKFFEDDLNRAIGTGVYQISIMKDGLKQSLYIGKSVYMIKRCGEHLYTLNQRPEYLGLTSDDLNNKDLYLIFEVLETEIRKDDINLEIAAIKKHQPLTQTGISDYQCKIEKKIENVQAFLNM